MTNPFERGGSTSTPTQAPAQSPAPVSGGVSGVQSPNDPYGSVSSPTGVSGVRMSDEHIFEQLLLIEPTEWIPSMMTAASREPTSVVRADILPLTGPAAEKMEPDVLIFQEALKRELKKTLDGPNRWMLAYLTKGTAKPGQSAPYIFVEADQAQKEIFERFRAKQASQVAG